MFYILNPIKIYNGLNKITISSLYKINWILSFKYIQLIWYFISINMLDKKFSKNIYNKEILTINNNQILYVYSNNINYDKVIIICHAACGNYTQSSYFANFLIKNNNALIVSYSRKGAHKELNNNNFNLVGCPSILDEIVKLTNLKFNKPIYAIAFSAGTSLLSTYLSNYNTLIKSAFLISPGFCYENSIRRMSNFPKILSFIHIYKTFYHIMPNNLKNKYSLISLMDNLYIQLPYKTKTEYFLEHNPINYLHKINIPIICINAIDDICFPIENIKEFFPKVLLNKNITIITLKYGSHLGFFNYFNFNPIYFNFISQYLKYHILLNTNNNFNYLHLIEYF